MPDKDAVLNKLSAIRLPGAQEDIVSLGYVKDLVINDKAISVRVEFTSPKGGVENIIKAQVINGLRAIGFESVQAEIVDHFSGQGDTSLPQGFEPKMAGAPGAQQQQPQLVPGVKYIVAVASGKGGVGKSTVSVNLACALSKLGQQVGLLDADVYGPNIPMMMNLEGQRPKVRQDQRIDPLMRDDIKIMSLGFLTPGDAAIIWRGPLVGRAIEQMLGDVHWGELDFLILDLPPGTGDAQLTISQRLDLAGAVLVSTPQPVALSDGLKGLRMFEKVKVPILGMIENMSTFVCDECGKEHDLFGKGGVEKACKREGVTFLGNIPITPEIRVGGDTGKPVVLDKPNSPAAMKFMEIAENIIQQLTGSDDKAPEHFTF